MKRNYWILICLIAPIVSCSPARSQFEAADHLYPAGAQRGTTVSLTFSGMADAETATLLIDGPGIRPLGPFLKGAGKVEIAPDAAPGARQLRLVSAKKATNP